MADITHLILNGNTFDITDEATETEVEELKDKMRTAQRNLSVLFLYGDENELANNIAEQSKAKMNFRYAFYNVEENKQKYGWCKLSLQGNSTLHFPKKNFNIQFYKDANYSVKDKVDPMDLTDDKHPKWTLKANYNDYSQARNIVSARVWGDLVHSRSNMSKALSDAPNHGAIDGHPCLLYLNDAYYGLYDFNMSKSDWMLGIDEDNPYHCAVSSNLATNATKWISTGLSGWELEIPDTWQTVTDETEGTTTSVQAGFTALQSFVINSTDAEFAENIGNYLNVPSAIDYLIYSFCLCNADSMNKNQFLVTWDAGKTWTFTAYDMDQTFGAGFNSVIPYTHDLFSTHPNHLFGRLIDNFATEIVNRYHVLRESILSYNYISRELELFFNEIPNGEREKDYEKWGGSFRSISTLEAMQTFTQNRLIWCDTYFAHIDPNYVACTGISLNKNSISFTVPVTEQLIATITPSNASDPIVWASSASNVATVSQSGLVTVVSDGVANITVTCGEQTATCAVSVTLATRGEVDYTQVERIGQTLTWTDGYIYDPTTGEMVVPATDGACSSKFQLQNCLYQVTGGSWLQLFVWDENNNYLGCFAEGTNFTFSAKEGYYYGAKTGSGRYSSVVLTPVNNSATEGETRTITIDSVANITNGTYYYNNSSSSKFNGLISSNSSSVLDYSAVDWIYYPGNGFVSLGQGLVKKGAGTDGINVLITGTRNSTVDVWFYVDMTEYPTTSDFNAYLAENPIVLIMNLE